MLPLAIPQHRAEVGDPLDRFYTPDSLADGVVEWVWELLEKDHNPTGPLLWVAEPSVGGGAFLRAIRRHEARRAPDLDRIDHCTLWGCDLDPTAEGLQLLRDDPRGTAVVGDWELIARQAQQVGCIANGLVIGNPPFTHWMAHVLAARQDLPLAWLAFILPVEHVCTREGNDFLSRYVPRYIRPIIGRAWPKSVRGCAGYVWPPTSDRPHPTELVLPGITF